LAAVEVDGQRILDVALLVANANGLQPRETTLRRVATQAMWHTGGDWHRSCKRARNGRVKMTPMLKLTWLPHWRAYSIRLNGKVIGLVRCGRPLPFRHGVQFEHA